MYAELCPFCGFPHHADYWEDVEAQVMACREQATPEARGTIDSWRGRVIYPVPCEIAAYGVGGP